MAEGVSKITQRQRVDYDDNGNLVDVIEITFRVDDDGPFHVSVPVDSYDVETVRAYVNNVVARVRAARKLLGG